MPRERAWDLEEPGLRDALHQLVRLTRRAVRRPLAVLALAALGSALTVGGVLVKEQTFASPFVLRVVEVDRDPHTAPRPKRRLREHVRDAVFSSSRLLEVLRRHGLYPSLTRDNPQAALTSFREDIDVDVFRNYFVEERSRLDPPRSARVAIRYYSADKRLAVAVSRDLGRLVIRDEQERRERQAEQAARDAEVTAAAANERLYARETEVARGLGEAPSDPAIAVELAGLMHSLEPLRIDAEHAERRKAALDVGRSLENHGMGLHFDVVDEGGIPASAGLDLTEAGWLALVMFLFGLPLAAVSVGAFSSTVHDTYDIELLGLRPLGHLPNLKGTERGYV